MSAALPREVASGSIHVDGRRARCVELDDGRRLFLDEPVADMVVHDPDSFAYQEMRVEYADASGFPCEAFDASAIVKLAAEWGDGGYVIDDDTNAIRKRCARFLSMMPDALACAFVMRSAS
jgi:hypothetical protein